MTRRTPRRWRRFVDSAPEWRGKTSNSGLQKASAWRMHAVAHTPADRFKATLVPRIHPDREQGSALF